MSVPDSCERQLEQWLAGNPAHNTERDECCPDFSCCKPGALAPFEEREHFVQSDDAERERMLFMFLSRAVADKSVHVVAPPREEE